MMTVRNLRKSRGFSQAELAKKAGVDVTHLCRLEAGRGACSVRTLHRILLALNASDAESREVLAELATVESGQASPLNVDAVRGAA
jgi:transcriptional regulator with XRE-family HTH domain